MGGDRYRGRVLEACGGMLTADVDVHSRVEFQELVDDIVLRSRLPGWATPLRAAILVPGAIFVVGLLCALLVDSVDEFLASHAVYIFTLTLAVALATVLWLERAGPETVTDIETSFERHDMYYGLMGSMLVTMYQPFPHTRHGSRRERYVLSLFVVGSLLAGMFAFAVVPSLFTPDRFGQALGMDWGGLHPLLQTYVFFLVGVASLVGVLVSWVVLVGAWHMGIEARELHIALDITRATENLGLTPYARLIVLTAGAYFLVYLITTSVFLVVELNAVVALGLAILTALPLVGFVGSQYGLHVAIRRSKRRRLRRLSEEFDEELDHWFRHDGPAPPPADPELGAFVAATESIESLPDWPVNVASLAKLLSAALASNVWVIQEALLACHRIVHIPAFWQS